MTTDYRRFTKDNASEAVPLIGQRVWFYTREDLFLSNKRRESTKTTLTNVFVGSENPFWQDYDRGFPFIVIEDGKP